MATRAQYRATLKDKPLATEDEGHGDFEFTDAELTTYLELSVARMFPAVYQRKVQSGLSLTSYGTGGYFKEVSVLFPERVFRVEDATERIPYMGWEVLPTSILGVTGTGTVNVYYYDAYELPA